MAKGIFKRQQVWEEKNMLEMLVNVFVMAAMLALGSILFVIVCAMIGWMVYTTQNGGDDQWEEGLTMEKFEPSCPWHIQVEDLFIAPGRVPNQGTIWIGDIEGGQGGEFRTKDLHEVLRKFYDENF